MLYFAYGSNMSSRRLERRVRSASFVAVATLFGHDLRFHKRGRDGSAKCDALETGYDEHAVIGVLFEIPATEKPALDRAEGLGQGYEEKPVSVKTESGDTVDATTYYATHIDPSLKPFRWYKQHVIQGAKEHGLPKAYVERVASVESVSDPKRERHRSELAIYAGEGTDSPF